MLGMLRYQVLKTPLPFSGNVFWMNFFYRGEKNVIIISTSKYLSLYGGGGLTFFYFSQIIDLTHMLSI